MPHEYDQVIADHYKTVAQKHGLSPSSTMEDVRVRDLETKLIVAFVKAASNGRTGSSRICDIGCGNGYTLSVLRNELRDVELSGFDYSEDMVKLAQERFAGTGIRIERHDVRSAFDRKFDVIVVQRVIINLLSADDRATALANITDALTSGGKVLFIESFTSGLNALNEARAEFDLEPIPPAHHNEYLEDDFFDKQSGLKRVYEDLVSANFLSSHYYVSRVFHAAISDKFVRNSHFVHFFSNLVSAPIGHYAPVQAYAFERIAASA